MFCYYVTPKVKLYFHSLNSLNEFLEVLNG